jgi:hypothetical protein
MAKKKSTKFKLPKGSAEENEWRRLVQNANRRIEAATKAYEKAGMLTAPKKLTGGFTVREKWFSEKYALSRSKVFESEAEYKKMLAFVRQFDPSEKDKNADYRPNLTEYAEQERANTIAAVGNVLGVDVEEEMSGLAAKINRLSATQLTAFWKAFTKKAQQQGVKYSSVQAMEDTLREFFPEDMQAYNDVRAEQSMILQYKQDMMKSKEGL